MRHFSEIIFKKNLCSANIFDQMPEKIIGRLFLSDKAWELYYE